MRALPAPTAWRSWRFEPAGAEDDRGLSGVWRREGRSLCGSRTAEPSLAVWLQVGRWFADVRVPRAGRRPARVRNLGELDHLQAFSGQLELDGDRVRFVHDLDTLARSSPDEARLEWRGELLEETGDGYVERWRRMTDAASAARAGLVGVVEGSSCVTVGHAPRVIARLVQVGDVAAAVWSSPVPGGTLLQRGPSRARRPSTARWRPVATVGDPAGGGLVEEALAHLRRAT